MYRIKIVLGDSVVVAAFGLPIWSRSSEGEIVDGFQLVDDGISASVRFGCATTKILN